MTHAIVTGASGFIGRHLVYELKSRKIQVTELSRGQNPQTYADVFYHLAWDSASGVGRSDAVKQSINTEMTLNALAAAANSGCKRFIALGTIYERLAHLIKTSDKTGSSDFYILSKEYAHTMTHKLALKLGIDFVWCTVCHPIGRYIKKEQMIAYAVLSLLRGQVPEFGPAQIWYDIIAVEDLAYALCLAGECKLREREYFLGSCNPRILRDYISKLPKILGIDIDIAFDKRPDDGLRFDIDWFDCSSFVRETQYKPKISYEAAIHNTARWLME